MNVEGKRILVTGGTGSLGQTLVRRLLSGEFGTPEFILVFSRDEAKQHDMRLSFSQLRRSTDEVIYDNFSRRLRFFIGDVRNMESLRAATKDIDIVFHAAAMKQVPSCEYFPEEAQRTNIGGAANLIAVLQQMQRPVETVVGISTDKAVKPVNVMGMTKAVQERLFVSANVNCPATRFVVARYGNVLASRGSVIPLFQQQISQGGPITITDPAMTRFLMSLDDAVDAIAAAVALAEPGETIVPRVPAAKMIDLARCMRGSRPIEIVTTGIRPGEKLHEILISDEERHRTFRRGAYYAIRPMLPELQPSTQPEPAGLDGEYSSSDSLLPEEGILDLLARNHLLDTATGAGAASVIG